MPQLNFSFALGANQVGGNPISGWQYEYLPWPARMKLLIRSTAAAGKTLGTVYTGSETIMERSVVQIGGTAGVTPSELNTPPIEWFAAAGDRVKVLLDDTGGVASTVDGIIFANPL